MTLGYEISEIEDVAEERFALTAVAGSVVVIVVTMVPNLMIPVAMLRRAARLIVTAASRGRRGHGALDDLVELAAVKPDAAAFRTIVDLYALAIRITRSTGQVGHFMHETPTRNQDVTSAMLAPE